MSYPASKPPTGHAAAGTAHSGATRATAGGIFDDYNFRFSNTYTIAEPGGPTSAPPPLSSSASRHTPRGSHSQGPSAAPNAPRGAGRGDALQLTNALQDGLARQDAQRRLRQARAEKQAAALLRYTHARKPQVAPSFVVAAAAPAGSTTGSSLEPAPSSQPEDGAAAARTMAVAGSTAVVAVSTGPYKPTGRPLPAPALGMAAGVEAGIMGEESDVFALTASDQAAVMHAERSAHAALFDWWEERAAARASMRFRSKLDTTLQATLESNAKDLIAKEESFWLEELGAGVVGLRGARVAVNPKLKSTLTAALARAATGTGTGTGGTSMDMMAHNNGLSPAGATARGIIVPLQSLETLFRSLRIMLHERASTLLSTYEESQWALNHAFDPDAVSTLLARADRGVKDKVTGANSEGGGAGGIGAPPALASQQQQTRQACRAYLTRLYETERSLAREAMRAGTDDKGTGESTSDALDASLTPACVALPPDRMLQPLMVLETATSVALLWKVLEQARTVIPGMDFALLLYRHYILPHLYDHYAAFDGVLPHQVGSLCDQVGRLCGLPLRMRGQLLAAEALREGKEDVRYMEYAMKRWTVRTWRKSVLDRRRQETARAACMGLLDRANRRAVLRDAFGAWRMQTRESAYAAFMKRVEDDYKQFLAGSALSARMDCLRTASEGPGESRFPTGTRARMVAVRLAETATHVKGAVRDAPRGPPPPPRSATAAGSPAAQRRRTGTQQVFLPSIGPAAGGAGRSGESPTDGSHRSPRGSVLASERGGGGGEGGELEQEDTEAVVPTLSGAGLALAAVVAAARASVTNATEGGDTPAPVPAPAPVSVSALAPGPFGSGTVFDEMLSRLHEADEVCNHLRSEIAVQSRMITRLEQEKRGLQERNRTLEADLVRTVEEKLHYCNVVQEKQFHIQDRDRRITQLKSRLRAHRHRPWQRTVMRIMGEFCGASTQHAEAMDEYRLRRDLRSDPRARAVPALTSAAGTAEAGSPEAGGGAAAAPRGSTPAADEAEDAVALATLVEDGPEAREAEQERLYGELAPIVLSSTRQLPDALVILLDWANSCLDDLQALDDLKGGALSVRFSSFSEEARSGVLLSRLLFYLALPRYLQWTAANGDDGAGGGSGTDGGTRSGQEGRGRAGADGHFGGDFADRRRQLLEQRNVQLDSPFPTYSECFGDLLSMRPHERMALLLRFATELVSGTDVAASEALALKRQAVEEAVYAATDLAAPLPAGRIELQEIVDPHALSAGERAPVVTLVALLYVRFAHPFNHKCRQSAELERAQILYLLGGGGGGAGGGEDGVRAAAGPGGVLASTLEEELLANLEDEDKSPWQLFKERCMPVFGSPAHPFLLRGNFWPSSAFDSPALVNLLGELGAALNRSLQLHRWHVTLCCLVPVVTYAGLSRAIFTGPRASPAALRVGLVRDGQWEFPLHSARIRQVCENRFRTRPRSSSPLEESYGMDDFAAYLSEEKHRLLEATTLVGEDLLTLFLRRATLSPELALPVMDLGGWRLLCADLAVVGLELGEEGNYPMDLEVATRIYFAAIAAVEEATGFPRLFAIATEDEDHAAAVEAARASPAGGPNDHLPRRGTAISLDSPAGLDEEDAEEPRLSPTAPPVTSAALEPMRTPPAPSQKPAGPHDVLESLPLIHMDMAFTAFATAMVLVADRLYRPYATRAASKTALWLGDALTHLVRDHVLHSPAGNMLVDEPRTVIRRLQMGADTQEVLALYTPALTLVYNAYSKDVYGSAGMEKEDLLQLLRDAMLTSTEISQYLVYELFQYCCVTRKASEEVAAGKRREIDGRPRLPGESDPAGGGPGRERRPGVRSVSIVDPHPSATPAAGKRKDIQVLVLQGFIEFLCILCHFKQPNPLIPVHQRMNAFLRRSVLRPLNRKVEGVTAFLNQLKVARDAQEGAEDRRAGDGGGS